MDVAFLVRVNGKWFWFSIITLINTGLHLKWRGFGGEALSEEIVFADINAIIGQSERKAKVPLADIKKVSVTSAGTLK
jgi:hypothetical protein